jgi:hypothetical protein
MREVYRTESQDFLRYRQDNGDDMSMVLRTAPHLTLSEAFKVGVIAVHPYKIALALDSRTQ